MLHGSGLMQGYASLTQIYPSLHVLALAMTSAKGQILLDNDYYMFL